MKVKVLGSTLLVIVLLSSSVSATTTAGFYGVNSISTFLNRFAIRFIERFCVDNRGAKVDSRTETDALLGGDADDYANGRISGGENGEMSKLTSGYDGLGVGRNAQSKKTGFYH